MPSRRLLSSPSPPSPPRRTSHLLPPLAGGLAAAVLCCFLILLLIYFRRISRKRTAPTASDTDSKKPPHRLSYSLLRRATANFSPSLRLGQGGFGSVYRAEIKPGGRYTSDFPIFTAPQFAVKAMDSGSLQGEREFQNELVFSSKIDCKYIVSVIGFSSNPNKRRMLLIYELMENGSLQDCLFHKKSAELKIWDKRFSIALSIAKGLEYLHHYCDPPIIHGDIKPSNILLDSNFNAKIGDFGLARFKMDDDMRKELGQFGMDDNGSMVETDSVITTSCFDEVSSNVTGGLAVDRSPESVSVTVVEASPPKATVAAIVAMDSPGDGVDEMSISDGNFDKLSAKKKKESPTGKDWWWRQDFGNGDTGTVKDYVMEWLGNEIKNERPTIGASLSSQIGKEEKKKKKRRQLDWWASMADDSDKNTKKNRRRPAREWWKEEYCDELERKKKNKKTVAKHVEGSMSDDYYSKNKKRNRSKSRGSRGSVDWWLDGLSGEIPKSGGISSTPSMRGTVCYIAPESCGGSEVSEKCDVYSFGVLLLVLVAGRRPLQVTGSPMSEFRRANLLSWARHLARAGKPLDLLDEGVEDVDKEEALLCITVAMLCLQKSPGKRPSMKELVGMLTRDLALPELPVEFSPLQFPFRVHKKGR